eukprot:1448194-Amphidinium_carterae.1
MANFIPPQSLWGLCGLFTLEVCADCNFQMSVALRFFIRQLTFLHYTAQLVHMVHIRGTQE